MFEQLAYSQFNQFDSEDESEGKVDSSKWGTFRDSLREPIHNWFTYPAGFSYKPVEYYIEKLGLDNNNTIYDPFMGSGTTNLTAKMCGVNSVGVEAHPFVYPIAKTKLNSSIFLTNSNSLRCLTLITHKACINS